MSAPPILEARGIVRLYRRGGAEHHALGGVDLEVRTGGITALVGPSGSGKSTLARCLSLLERPDAGRILHDGVDVGPLRGRDLAAARRRVQLVLQDPARSFAPRSSVRQAIHEPLAVGGTPRRHRAGQAEALLREVGLDPSILEQRARDLSGGQAQRLAFARALACEPDVLLLDETLSGLDLSLRARLVGVLLDVLEGRGLTCVLVSHDPDLTRHLADEVVTLEEGRVVGVERRS